MLDDWWGCDADACSTAFRSSDARRRAARAFSSRRILFSALCFAHFALFSSFLCSASSIQPLSMGSRTLRTSCPYRFAKIQPGTSSMIRSTVFSRACVASFESILSGRIASGIKQLRLKSRLHISTRQDPSAFRHALRRSPRRGPSPVPLRARGC